MPILLDKVWLNGNLSMFGKTMALWAKSYQIAKAIGFLVVVIFAWDIVKLPKWFDVMHVEPAPLLLLAYTAMAASVTVTLARMARLSPPVGAIVFNPAPPPVRILVTSANTRLSPFLHASLATEVMFVSVQLTLISLAKFLTTTIANSQKIGVPSWVIFSPLPFAKPKGLALYITKLMLGDFQTVRVAAQTRTAVLTNHVNLRLIPWIEFSLPLFRLPLSATIAVAKKLTRFVSTYLPRFSYKTFTTGSTLDDDHVPIPHKQPLGVARACYRTGCQRAAKVLSRYSVERAKIRPVAYSIIAQMGGVI